MSSRREQRERLRQERLAHERAARAAAGRRRMIQVGVSAGAVILIAAAVGIVAVATAGSSNNGAEAGDQATPAPWQPEYGSLQKRVRAMGLPQASDFPFHIHAMLRVYVDGERVAVPSQIGIDPSAQFIAPLHTHDASGIVHMEAVRTYPFKLGQFFNVWGVKFSDRQIGAYRDGGDRSVQVYVNGKRVADPASYVMKKHDRIVVAYGKPDSFPKRFSTPFPPGL